MACACPPSGTFFLVYVDQIGLMSRLALVSSPSHFHSPQLCQPFLKSPPKQGVCVSPVRAMALPIVTSLDGHNLMMQSLAGNAQFQFKHKETQDEAHSTQKAGL